MSYVAEKDSSGVGEALFCLIPVIGWLSCLSGCSSADVPGPTIVMPDGGEIFDYEDVKEMSDEEVVDAVEEGSGEATETVDEFISPEIKSDITDAAGELSDAEAGTDEETQPGELPNYDTPIGAEEIWQSKFESLGLCYNEFSTCKLITDSPCWYINKMNGSKPDTLAFLDPSLEKIDIALEGGPSDISETLEFTRVDEEFVMDNGFFFSATWMAGDAQIVANFIGDTVDLLFIKNDIDPDIGACEYDYNYPCPVEGMCDT